MQWQPGRPGWRGLAILFFLRPRGLAAEDDQSEEQQRKDAGGCRGPLRQHHGCVAAPRSGRTPADRKRELLVRRGVDVEGVREMVRGAFYF